MKFLWRRLNSIVIPLAGLFLLHCEESLPPYAAPEQGLVLDPIIVSQGTVGPGFMVINVLIQGENQYEEVFQDTVNVQGELNIYWLEKPEFVRNIPLNNSLFLEPTPIRGRTLTLEPGQKFAMQVVWYLDTDDGFYIPDSLSYMDESVNGFQYAEPATFIMQVRMTVFNQLGLLETDPKSFVLFGFRPVTSPGDE